jgi:CubicO group peptidase (beta-lactamase class C family)
MHARLAAPLAALVLLACATDAPSGGAPGPAPGGGGGTTGAGGSSDGGAPAAGDDAGGSPGGDAGSPSGDGGDPARDAIFADVVAYLKAQLAKNDVPGASIAIVLDGKLAYSAGVGVKTHGGSDAVDAATLFRVGSMSKMIVGAAMMTLVEAGKVDPAQPVTAYVPGLKLATGYDASTIHVEHALTHTSGIEEQTITTCAHGPGELAKWFAANPQPLWAPPGAVWNYANLGISLAGLVVESAGGAAFEDYVRSHVFGPAGMTTATYDPVAARAADHAVGWGVGADGTTKITEEPDAYDCSIERPPGGVIASALDYAHFAETLLAGGGSMLSAKSVQTMTSARVDTHEGPTEHYGYGLFVDDGYKGLHSVEHGGSIPGYLTSFWTVPARGFAAIVLTNGETYDPVDTSLYAVDKFLAPPDTPPPSYTTPPSTWGVYAGTYADPTNSLGTMTVTLANGQLTATAATIGMNAAPLTQVADDLFVTPDPSGGQFPVVFWRNAAAGPVTYVVTPAGDGKKQ